MEAISGLTDHSGSIAVNGTAQDAVPENHGRRYLFIQNIDSAEDLWVDFGTDAAISTAGSILIVAKGALVYENTTVPGDRVSVIGNTAGHKYTIKEG